MVSRGGSGSGESALRNLLTSGFVRTALIWIRIHSRARSPKSRPHEFRSTGGLARQARSDPARARANLGTPDSATDRIQPTSRRRFERCWRTSSVLPQGIRELRASLRQCRSHVSRCTQREVLLDERLELVQRQGFVRYEQAVGHLQTISRRRSRELKTKRAPGGKKRAPGRKWTRNRGLRIEIRRRHPPAFRRCPDAVRRSRRVSQRGQALVSTDAIGRTAARTSWSVRPPLSLVRGGIARPESEIKERARSYLPDVLEVKDLGPVLDLGPGRCEWLSLFGRRNRGIGVEINDLYVAKALERGFHIRPGDAIEYLKGLSEGELGAVTAFHLVEHIDVDSLIGLLDLALPPSTGWLADPRDAGPENLIVGASNFYLDPTHRHPLPPPLLSFLVRSRDSQASKCAR